MPTYKYEGAYASGEKVSGVVEAVSRTDAVNQIRQSCEIVLSIKEVPKSAARDPLSRLQKISAKSLSLTCQQFAIILKAGLPLVQTVDLVAGQCPDKNLSALLRQVSEDVSNGWSLSYSLEQRGAKSLPVTFRETVRAGEESGDLQAAFQRMADYFERMNKTRESLLSALTYPVFVIIVAVAVIIIVMNFVIPTFSGMFTGMGVDLPFATRALISLSGFFQKYTLVLIAAIALVILLLRLYGTMEKGGPALARVQLNLPLIGNIVRMTNASQFAHTMSTLLTAGMPILQSIEVAGKTMGNLCMAKDVLDTLPGVEGGRTLGECMGYSKELPPMLVQMTSVGEATGSMESTLEVLAAYYDNETDIQTKLAITLLEPMIIVILSIFVAFILVAVYLPMFSLYANM
ncbi:type II secretion system F family protein [uncultured Oscillibacter sp.]|uniref:type II secretion system F family protein n=1 Tax=uncultured Oscillibacter sp. TaxID=876091 RepID=UPI00263168C4|nr:type II secretion system F family protein [uncultured Oscillibacter sp.]